MNHLKKILIALRKSIQFKNIFLFQVFFDLFFYVLFMGVLFLFAKISTSVDLTEFLKFNSGVILQQGEELIAKMRLYKYFFFFSVFFIPIFALVIRSISHAFIYSKVAQKKLSWKKHLLFIWYKTIWTFTYLFLLTFAFSSNNVWFFSIFFSLFFFYLSPIVYLSFIEHQKIKKSFVESFKKGFGHFFYFILAYIPIILVILLFNRFSGFLLKNFAGTIIFFIFLICIFAWARQYIHAVWHEVK